MNITFPALALFIASVVHSVDVISADYGMDEVRLLLKTTKEFDRKDLSNLDLSSLNFRNDKLRAQLEA